MNLCMFGGDFNWACCKSMEEFKGAHGGFELEGEKVGERVRLLEFCEDHDLVAVNMSMPLTIKPMALTRVELA